MTPERKFYNYLKESLPKNWFLQRIETTTAIGVPDLNILIPDYGEMWLEIKSCKTKVKLRKEQFAWITKRWLFGGKVAVINRNNKNQIQIWFKPFSVNPSGNKYLSINSRPDAILEKSEWKKVGILFTLYLTEPKKTEK